MHRDFNLHRFASALIFSLLAAGSAPGQPESSPLEQTQYLGQPVGPEATIPDSPTGPRIATGISSTAPRASTVVNDPPTPTVQLQIRTPAHVANGKLLTYKLIVINNSSATAYRVRVRVPLPENGKMTKRNPEADSNTPKELTWDFKSLAKGEQKVIELEFEPAVGVKEVRLRGHVSFEHGSEVVTTIDKPKLTVKKTATQQVSMGELVTVRVEVVNAGTVPIPNSRLVETVTAGTEFKNDQDSEKGADANQRSWQLGTLEPGQTKIVTYQLLGKKGGELVTTSIAASEDKFATVQSETAESKTKILVPALKLELSGPDTVASKEAGLYTVRVLNSGTQPLENVRILLSYPEDCEVTKVTSGFRRAKGQVLWVVPKLPAGEARDYRLSLESPTSGKKIVKVIARETRSTVEDTKEFASTFLGRADLTWKPEFDDVSVNVGKRGLLTVKVKNTGTETEKATRLRVALPANVTLVEGSPKQYDVADTEVIFKPRPLTPGQTETFTITYEAKQAGPANFRLLLEADSLGKVPLSKDQLVQINNAR